MNGLLERDLKFIIKAISYYPEIDEVIVFGSRAMGNYKKSSDVDIALKGQDVNHKIVRKLSGVLNEEYPLPYFFDVLSYHEISNEELKKHIDNEGKLIYKRGVKG